MEEACLCNNNYLYKMLFMNWSIWISHLETLLK